MVVDAKINQTPRHGYEHHHNDDVPSSRTRKVASPAISLGAMSELLLLLPHTAIKRNVGCSRLLTADGWVSIRTLGGLSTFCTTKQHANQHRQA